jgi:hypothetical protein
MIADPPVEEPPGVASIEEEQRFVIEDRRGSPAPQKDHIVAGVLISNRRAAGIEQHQFRHRPQPIPTPGDNEDDATCVD